MGKKERRSQITAFLLGAVIFIIFILSLIHI